MESYDEPPTGVPAARFEQLTEASSPGPDPDGAQFFRPLGRSARAIMTITGMSAALALVVVVASAISERPIPGLRIAVVPAVAVLVVGQLWVIVVLNRRYPVLWGRSPLRFGEVRELFSPLRRRIVLGIFAVFAVGCLSAATAALTLANGVPPAIGRQACPYRADRDRSSACMSKSAWLHAVAAEERGAAGVMLGFFVADFGVAWSEALRSRQA